MKCPKCGYERRQADEAPEWQCPSCKVAYAKVLQAQNPGPKSLEAGKHLNQRQPAVINTDAQPDDDTLEHRHWLASRGQKMVIYSVLLNFVLRGVERAHVLSSLIVEVLFVCVAVYSVLGMVKICSGLGKSQNQKILFMVLSFFPLVNLAALVYLNAKATKMLKDAGWKIGLLGARS